MSEILKDPANASAQPWRKGKVARGQDQERGKLRCRHGEEGVECSQRKGERCGEEGHGIDFHCLYMRYSIHSTVLLQSMAITSLQTSNPVVLNGRPSCIRLVGHLLAYRSFDSGLIHCPRSSYTSISYHIFCIPLLLRGDVVVCVTIIYL